MPEPNAGETPTPPSCYRTAVRWAYLLRYHRTSQLIRRLIGVGRRRLFRFSGGRRYLRPPAVLPTRREGIDLRPLLEHKTAERRTGDSAGDSAGDATRILQGRFTFLHCQQTLGDPVDWRLDCWPDAPQLWRFHLHYQQYLLDLAAEALRSGDRTWLDRAWQLVVGWIDGNLPSDASVLTDAWHPFCISRRLPVWVLLASAGDPPEQSENRIIGSMFSQACFLERHLERDLGGNHLLENAKALTIVGAFLDGPDADRWLHTGATIFRKELARQILPHGEHFERSPMYHALMLECVLDVRDVLRPLLPETANACAEAAARMAAFLREILHPDGDIPLLGDAYLDEATPADQLITRAGVPDRVDEIAVPDSLDASSAALRSRVVGDYWIFRHERDFLLLDAGPVGPDELPAHAHADLLGLEASIRGRRLFVDGGVFNYQDDAMRRYCRGSTAHNVLQIDDCDQCDVWSRFRMGYRGWPSGITTGTSHGYDWARADHNAYRRLGVPLVGRWIACRPKGPWFLVDWAQGRGSHKLTSRLHLHPDVRAERIASDRVRIVCGDVTLTLQALAPGELALTTGWYCPELGRRLPCPVVLWTATNKLPSACGWCLRWNHTEAADRAELGPFDGENTVLHWHGDGDPVQLRPMGNAKTT